MDYKELIKKLREKGGCNCECLQAATVIETLLEERDAAVADIDRCCATCKHFLILRDGCTPDYDCGNPECKNISGVNTGWQWRGLQKEGGNDV